MYYLIEVEDVIRVPPEKLGKDVKEAIRESVEEKYSDRLDKRIGMVLGCVEVEEVKEGKIIPGDPGVFYKTRFKLMSFKPEMHELVRGEVIDNTEFGAFVRIGALDGLVHISQIMDDFVSYDEKNSVFLGKETKKTLKEGDLVRARIISISLKKDENKIGLTMRQPGLGSLTWIEEEKKKKKG